MHRWLDGAASGKGTDGPASPLFRRWVGLLAGGTLLLAACAPAAPAAPGGTTAQPATAAPAPPAATTANPASSGSGGLSGKTVRIGGIDFLTGSLAAFSLQELKGEDMAVEDINAAGGINGAKIDIVHEDAASDREQAIALLRKQAADPSYLAILGIEGTAPLIPAAALLPTLKIAVVNPSSAAAWQGDFNPWTFRVATISNVALPLFLQNVKTKFKVNTLAVIYDQKLDYSASELNLINANAPKVGLDLVGTEAINTGDVDFSAQLTKLLPKNPDAIYLSHSYNEAALIMQQARQRGYQGLFIGGDGPADPSVFKLSGGAAKGFVTSLNFNLGDSRAWVQDFYKKFKQRYSEEVSAHAVAGYDAARLIADAAKRANTTSDRDAFRAAMGSTKDFEGVAGKYTYDGSGDNKTQSVYLYQMDDKGVYQPVS